ncbi:hypothetical protein BU26DRAFT_512473 [Trematosphaeria pertusa]|uniref:RNA polymerase II assembly factor Rtp1 C-terminal domain-containing protein n=1 Tax=Trematosphaeria pertusa TaxID=390896 RepID=A0A6A6IY79_9PLEO|nr:uncharacterized protein BU26DRAFT_512473 [Trematosphaeria pertusa]KAF2255501.1 hypothetical protein BU26DRAFT_512473 [Trematosphaeria pertusa]
MGAVEDAVDAAAHFVSPFLDQASDRHADAGKGGFEARQLVEEALSHLQAINTAEQASDPDAPYDASLVGIMYGLLDLIASLGILPHLSPGVLFNKRPRSVLMPSLSISSRRDELLLSDVTKALIPISEQNGTGVQPLLSQRLLPDIISALAELSFSPHTSEASRSMYKPVYGKVLATTPTSRLLPVLASFLQQDLPPWLRQGLSRELAMVPLRPHGVRHTIEFLSLSYLSKNSQVPQDASGSQAQLPLPLEAITQASKLLVSVPSGMSQDDWFTQLAPQLWTLLDGSEGKELSRAAGQIVAGGILNRKTTGSPGTIGWELFAAPLLKAIHPKVVVGARVRQSTANRVIVSEQDLELSLKRMATIASSYSHAGLIKRLVGPVLLSLWGLFAHATSRPSLDKGWTELPRAIILRYMTVACEPARIDTIADNLFWNGESSWTFAPGSRGGIEIRQRPHDGDDSADMGDILSRIGYLDERVSMLLSLLADANVEDQIAGAIFLQTTRKWLSPGQGTKRSLTQEPDMDPLAMLTYAKLSEAMAATFKANFARSPQHIIELMAQLLQNFVDEHKTKSRSIADANKPSRATLGSLAQPHLGNAAVGSERESEDLVSFALSIFTTVVGSPDFKRTPETSMLFNAVQSSLQYLSQPSHALPVPPLIAHAATNLVQIISPTPVSTPATDPLMQYRVTLKSAFTDLTSPEPPNRTWALSTLRNLIQNPTAFPLIDIPATTQMLLSVSIPDPESYVHLAAMPVLVDLAVRAPNPTIGILIDAFIDVDERSLQLKKEQEIEQALNFRLRVGEVLNDIVLEDRLWVTGRALAARYTSLKLVVEATLSLASRRGQRKQTLAKRMEFVEAERKEQEEGEAAWGGPIPNLLDPEAENLVEQAERDALLKILQGWEETGIEEDVRIRASALSILGSIMEERLGLLSQATVDAGLQMVLMILSVETGEAKGILRRAAVLVVMGLLKGIDAALEGGKESAVGLGMEPAEEVERVVKWVRDEDVDGLVRDHAGSVVEGLETLRMKKLYKIRDGGFRLGPDLGLEGSLRGLGVDRLPGNEKRRRGPIVEEIV